MDIRKSRDNFDKNGKLRCLNYSIYRYIAKEFQKPKRERKIRKCYKCDKVGYIVKNYRIGQKIKKLEYTGEIK